MKNRIFKTQRKKGLSMDTPKEINSLEELNIVLEESEGYAVGITLLNKGVLNHYLLTKKFPLLDLLKSGSKVKELMVEMLEKDQLTEF